MDCSKHDSLTRGLVVQLNHSPCWMWSEPVHAETLCRNSAVPSVRRSDNHLLGKHLLPDLRRSGSLVWHPANLGHVLFLPQLDSCRSLVLQQRTNSRPVKAGSQTPQLRLKQKLQAAGAAMSHSIFLLVQLHRPPVGHRPPIGLFDVSLLACFCSLPAEADPV